jgi:hypothetical protein
MITGHSAALISRAASSTASFKACLSLIGFSVGAVHAVAGQLQVDGPLVPVGRFQTAIDFAKSGQRVVQQGRGDRDLLEDLALRVEVPHAMVQERVRTTLIDPGGTTDHDDG